MTNTLTPSFDRLELMRTFIRIVDSKNLSSAALSLKTTQPTISRRLKALEESLGLKLIQRTTHQMQMTEEGRRFYYHAKDIVERWNVIEAEMTGAKTLPKGILRVQVPQALGIGKFNDVLSSYLKNHPQVDIEWILSDKSPDFISENLDCAIKVGNIDDPSLIAVKIFELSRIIVASPDLMDNKKKLFRPSELQNTPWLSFKTHYLDRINLFHSKTNEEITLKIHPRFISDNLFAMREAALMGLGIGVLSKWIVEKDLREGRLVQLCKDWQAASLPVYLIYPQSRLKPAKLQKFIELIKRQKNQL
ncbi:LysR family transcriptional regulator [Bacteriovorax stolpii]|uniref:LysR family transcriptional regulator n=1 Tax=Bacteriovorax stolpii TaxID=960 RepID=A0A2K9NPB0_BACTC|nr:LysR family transcriptional regulator [Bacteriovorax stolpii]AUN97356.1 LysR family transcriptional regulator [Bacteriovorax stolpii]QDK42674.1 LysR family transcriptional regulator [Bacteriovorax stolpii]TDP52527.1 LysR family transcriptional regulator [Bacteriovorax stolpii]